MIFGLTALLCSCSTTKYTYRQSNIPSKNVISGEVVVDTKLDLNKKIEATSSPRNSVNEAKEEAYYKAITQNNIDVVVDPIFEIHTDASFLGFGGKSTAKITGFGATYSNPRTKVEAINELTKVDTANIRKFDAIYLNKYTKKNAPQPANVSLTPSPTAGGLGALNASADKAKGPRLGWGVELTSMATGFVSGSTAFGDTATNTSIGLFKETSITPKFNLYRGVFYSTEGNGVQEIKYLRIPIMAKYFVFKKISINAGVQLGYATSFSGFDGLSDPASLDYGILYGLSYRISNGLSINYKFYKGINTVTSYYGQDLKNYNGGLSLAYHF